MKNKNIIFDVLAGLVIITVITLTVLITSMICTSMQSNMDARKHYVFAELMICVLPAGFASYLAAKLLGTDSRQQGLRRSIIWTVMVLLSFVLTSTLNSSFDIIFTTAAVYVLLVSVFTGPMIYVLMRHLN